MLASPCISIHVHVSSTRAESRCKNMLLVLSPKFMQTKKHFCKSPRVFWSWTCKLFGSIWTLFSETNSETHISRLLWGTHTLIHISCTQARAFAYTMLYMHSRVRFYKLWKCPDKLNLEQESTHRNSSLLRPQNKPVGIVVNWLL